tara:strand:+ start:364 stop:558 length:195 start_codon:yes stop_codon:yes gene_type:complete
MNQEEVLDVKNVNGVAINKGVELMLRQKNKKGEEQDHFKINFENAISLFKREFYFELKFGIKKT